MKMANLRDVAPPSAAVRALRTDEKVWQLNLDQIEAQTGRILSKVYSDASSVGSSTQPFDNGNVLFSKLRPYLNKVVLPDESGIATTELVPLRPDPERLERSYLAYYLRSPSFVSWASNEVAGAKMPRLVMQSFWKQQIPLPPLAEQKRIAAILDKADAIRRKLQQSLRLSDDFLRSVFLDMFGDPAGQGWDSTTVEELASEKKGSIRTGPFGSQLLHSEFVDEGIAVLGIDNAVRNKFAWGQPRFITEEKYEDLKRYTVHPGDVLITIMGTCGRCAIVPNDIPKAINTKHLCCITLNQKKCLPEFLHSYFLLHPMAKSYLGQAAKGAIMDGLNGGLIKSLPVPIVPIALQRNYAQLVKNRTKLADRLAIQAAESESLFSSLQQRAFRGEL